MNSIALSSEIFSCTWGSVISRNIIELLPCIIEMWFLGFEIISADPRFHRALQRLVWMFGWVGGGVRKGWKETAVGARSKQLQRGACHF